MQVQLCKYSKDNNKLTTMNTLINLSVYIETDLSYWISYL